MTNKWPGPLCFLGDFNSVRSPDERLRENIDKNSIDSFNTFTIQANLIDQCLSNDEFTREGPSGKFSRIDRVFINSKWALLWPEAILQTDHSGPSDHKPLIWAKKLANWGPRPFRFKRKVLCKSLQTRDLSALEITLLSNLKGCKKQISVRIESKRRLLSKFHWLKVGDKNSRFFHIVSRIPSAIINSSYVAGLLIDNNWVDVPDFVKEHAIDYFEKLFTAPPSIAVHMDINWATLKLARVPVCLSSIIEN
ncbi:uncharacterized protein [Rutidosis leptorrhynchoides]|uniref:uncharacterized protein n=1 Tax=Rutidosis leptorrhynchoides TaxID=125765 RepID=UPI003A98D2B0